jgi:hypothetical protein
VDTSEVDTLVVPIQEIPRFAPMEVRMQISLARSWTALRYDLSSQRALDNAARSQAEHSRVLAEIDAMTRRIDAATAPVDAESARRSHRVA